MYVWTRSANTQKTIAWFINFTHIISQKKIQEYGWKMTKFGSKICFQWIFFTLFTCDFWPNKIPCWYVLNATSKKELGSSLSNPYESVSLTFVIEFNSFDRSYKSVWREVDFGSKIKLHKKCSEFLDYLFYLGVLSETWVFSYLTLTGWNIGHSCLSHLDPSKTFPQVATFREAQGRVYSCWETKTRYWGTSFNNSRWYASVFVLSSEIWTKGTVLDIER